MSSPFLNLFTGRRGRRAVETVVPTRTFDDVILPPATRATLEVALAQVRSHALIFDRWGLGERHLTGLGLAFNFAGPPGTGKTICAEAIAHALGQRLLLVNYAEVESMWAGETAKNVAAVFRAASEEGAVLFFDEADAIAARRSAAGGAQQAYHREANAVVNVLLHELEAFNGVVVFATNLAANFDPAFERRIRTHRRRARRVSQQGDLAEEPAGPLFGHAPVACDHLDAPRGDDEEAISRLALDDDVRARRMLLPPRPDGERLDS